eukprot:Amastigsp_a185319_37.p4 type:complete len:136 gc:universal Amastigsp_a185319_37:90-497(+)
MSWPARTPRRLKARREKPRASLSSVLRITPTSFVAWTGVLASLRRRFWPSPRPPSTGHASAARFSTRKRSCGWTRSATQATRSCSARRSLARRALSTLRSSMARTSSTRCNERSSFKPWAGSTRPRAGTPLPRRT